MKKAHWLTLLAALALLVPLLAGPAAVQAGGPIGGIFLIRDEASVSTNRPAVAYNSQRQEYLVVFWNDRPGCDDIRAERVAKDGRLLGGVWVANGCPADRRYPDVAYNSQANEYLVVWEEDEIDIRGQRVSATGGLAGGAFDIALGIGGSSSCWRPAVAYASTENKYLVVLQLDSLAGCGIGAKALNSDGSAWGTYFDIEPLSTNQKGYPDLAYNYLRNEFLVVWAEQCSIPVQYDIRGRRVAMSGGAGPLGTAFWFSCDTCRDDLVPAVAAVPRSPDGQYLVAWEYWTGANNYDIWAQRVAGGGTLEGSAFLVFDSTASDVCPAVAGSESNQQYLVAWTTSPAVYPCICGRVVPTSGALVDAETVVGGYWAGNAAVASGPVGDALIAFQDTLGSGTYNIYGRLWGNRVYLPLVLRNY